MALSCSSLSLILFHWDLIPSLVFVIAVPWSVLSVSVDFNLTCSLALKTAIGMAVGVCIGLICTELEMAMTGGSLEYYVSTALSFPFAIILYTADDLVRSPLGKFIRADWTLLGVHMVASFSSGKPYWRAQVAATTMAVAAGVAVSISIIFRLASGYWSRKSKVKRALQSFSEVNSNVFKSLILCFLTGRPDNIRTDIEQFADELIGFGSDKDLRDIHSCVLVMPTQLLALSETLNEPYEERIVDFIMKPIQSDVLILTTMVSNSLIQKEVEHSISQICDRMYETLTNCVKSRDQDTQRSVGLMRLVFALVSIMRYARIADRFAACRLEFEKSDRSIRLQLSDFQSEIFRNLCDIFSYSAWSIALKNPKESIFKGFTHPIKIALILQILVQPLVYWINRDPEGTGAFVVWSLFSFFYSILSTVGGVLSRGWRNFFGTAVGGGLAVLGVLFTTANDRVAFYFMVVIAAFLGKLFSYVPQIDFAGCSFVMSFIVVSLANWDDPLDAKEGLLFAGRRVLLFGIGSLAAAILSMCILPRFASLNFRRSSANILDSCADLSEYAVKMITRDLKSEHDLSLTQSGILLATYEDTEVIKIHANLRREVTQRRLALKDTVMEMFALDVFSLYQRKSSSAVPTKDLIALRSEFAQVEDAALMLFGTASGTIISDDLSQLITQFLSEALNCTIEEIQPVKQQLSDAVRISGKMPRGYHKKLQGSAMDRLSEGWEALHDKITQEGLESKFIDEGMLFVLAYIHAIGHFFDTWKVLIGRIQSISGLQFETIHKFTPRLSVRKQFNFEPE